jgi:hypothetical protein
VSSHYDGLFRRIREIREIRVRDINGAAESSVTGESAIDKKSPSKMLEQIVI